MTICHGLVEVARIMMLYIQLQGNHVQFLMEDGVIRHQEKCSK